MKLSTITAVILMSLFMADEVYATENCSYYTYTWNTEQKKAVNQQKVVHSYTDLTSEEVDAATGCTVCIEGQVLINIPG